MAMLSVILVAAILSGLDNLQACTAIGVLALRAGRRTRYAVAFSVAEMAGALLGVACTQLMQSVLMRQIGRYSPVILLACGLAMLALALKERDLAAMLDRRGAVILLPAVLAIDNFFAGAGMASIHAPLIASALLIGAVGGAMSCAGLFIGSRLRRVLPFRLDFAAGIYMCVLAIFALVR
jgi:putative Mn2+ efflux pump MntP